MIHAFPGIVDAGGSCRLAVEHILGSLEHELLVTFDVDELIDYRGSRPVATFDGVRYASVPLPQVSLYLVTDQQARQFLLITGPEPDLQWRRMAQAVIDLVEFYGVDRVVGVSAFPTAVPHTRPISVIPHATSADLIEPGFSENFTSIEVPATFSSHLEFELGKSGHAALGFAAQIPHYLTRSDFPAGALALLRRVSESADLAIPLVGLGDVVELSTGALEKALEGNEEIAAIVKALEMHYDSGHEEDPETFTSTMDIPTAAEIGDRFERFLADQDEASEDHEELSEPSAEQQKRPEQGLLTDSDSSPRSDAEDGAERASEADDEPPSSPLG